MFNIITSLLYAVA